MARGITKTLVHPVTGQAHKFAINSPEDFATFKRYQQDWQPHTAARESDVSNKPLEYSSEGAALNPAGLTGREQLQLAAPQLLASLSMMVPPMRYGALLRTLLSGGLAAAGSQISGTDPKSEALTGMALNIPGEGLAGAVRGGGTGLMRKGIDASPELQASFGNVGKTAARERLGVANLQTLSEGPEKAGIGESMLGNPAKNTGSEGASQVMDKVKAKMTTALTRDPSVHNVQKDFLTPVRNRLYAKLRGQPRWQEQVKEMDAILAETAAQQAPTMDNLQALEFKSGAQRSSADLLKRGNKPTVSSAEAEARAAMAEMVDKEIQSVVNERLYKVPGYRAPATRFRELEGVRRALLEREVGRDATASPRAVTGGDRPRLAFNPIDWMSPQAMTSVGRGLDHPVTAFGVGNIPRALLEAMRLQDPTIEPTDIFAARKPKP